MTKITITQADREAAAAYMKLVGSRRWDADSMRAGGQDNTSIVIAFARHREQAMIEGARIALEVVRKAARDGLEEDVIRALDPAKLVAEHLKGDGADNAINLPSPLWRR